MNKNRYFPLSHFIHRSPTFPLNYAFSIDKNSFDIKLFNIENLLEEAIFISSQSLYGEMVKLRGGQINIDKGRFRQSLLQYYLRMSTRCTPFGLFAGCTIGTIGDETSIACNNKEKKVRKKHTRLDMNFLCALIYDIENQDEIKSKLKYFPNSSIYSIGNKLRYIEFGFENAKRVHKVTAVDNSGYLSAILKRAEFGCRLDELKEAIVSDNISTDDAEEFLKEVISAQLLVSELQPVVTGGDLLERLINQLEKLFPGFSLLPILKDIQSGIEFINKSDAGLAVSYYQEIICLVEKTGTKYDPKYIFQTDLELVFDKCSIDRKRVDEIQESLTILNKLTKQQVKSNLTAFTEKFSELYEEREMPLSIVLDPEIGIGYPPAIGYSVPAPLVDGLFYNTDGENNFNVRVSDAEYLILRKYHETIKNSSRVIEITEDDLKEIKAVWDDLPQTIAVMAEMLNDKIVLHSVGGSSAANLVGRFCYMNSDLQDFVAEIIEHDEKGETDAVYAEIVHLPEARVGNILFRPVIRQYEIPYLASSTMSMEHQIPVSDLFVSVRNSRIFLRSGKLNKVVIPRLTTAHNYSFNSLPIYHFLCDMQTHNLRGGLYFSWPQILQNEEYLPRVTYKNVILSLSRWFVKKEHVKELLNFNSEEELLAATNEWRNSKEIPQYVELVDGDNKLFVDLNNVLQVQMLFSVIKQRDTFTLQEFIHLPDKAIVHDEQGNCYTNQAIFTFTKDERL